MSINCKTCVINEQLLDSITRDLAKLVQALPAPKLGRQSVPKALCVIHLIGTLGAGKTRFARAMIQAFGHQGPVKSPTYTLVEPYEALVPPTYHFDLYRLADPEELEFIGIREYASHAALMLIEWPEKGQGFLPGPDLTLELSQQVDAFDALALSVLPSVQTLIDQGVINEPSDIFSSNTHRTSTPVASDPARVSVSGVLLPSFRELRVNAQTELGQKLLNNWNI